MPLIMEQSLPLRHVGTFRPHQQPLISIQIWELVHGQTPIASVFIARGFMRYRSEHAKRF